MGNALALTLTVTLVRSGVNRPEDQKATIKGLGLTRLHKSVTVNDTPAIRGMIRKVAHLVKVEPAA